MPNLLTAINPTTGQPSWQGEIASATDVDRAVVAARNAFDAWSSTSLETRIAFVEAYAKALKQHESSLVESICLSTGKPRWESMQEVAAMIGKVAVSIQAYRERCAETERDIGGTNAITRYRPHGVVAVLGPFNLPGHLPNGHIVPALIAGNTIIFKPSEQTPLVGERMMEAWHDVALPSGVLNMVQGGRDTGIALAKHHDINGLFFTGSFGAGLALSKAFGDTPQKILALEMGGNNPLIVHDVSDLQAAAYHTIQSAFITAGQRCTCARRLIMIDGDEVARFLDVLLPMVDRIRVGKWDAEPQPFMGPVISAVAARRVLEAQDDLIKRGGIVLRKSKAASGCAAMISPGVMDVTDVAQREDVEIFGPLLQLLRVKDFDEAIAVANDTQYGLAAGIICDDRAKYEVFQQRSRAGVIQWNKQTTGASGLLPFGGTGHSGNHRPSGYFAADYCSYVTAVYESERVTMPATMTPGLDL